LLIAYNLWHEDVTPALPAALAIEYFHNFSLIHDDIMDEAPLRRGKPAVHQEFNRNTAILSGDAMLIRSFDLLLEAGKQKNIGAALCSLLCKISLEICEGQQLDMDFESLASPTEAEYLEMIRKKTACLLGLSLQTGALLADAHHTEAKSLYIFGEKMGMGFQVQDDFLDVFGDVRLTGKQKGGDILRGKKNFLYVHIYNTISPLEQKKFIQTYAQAVMDQDATPVLNLYEKMNVVSYARKIQSDFFEDGLRELDNLNVSHTTKLKDMAIVLISRDH
jgi:geranylgeranyl diphosphate synthase type II